MSIKELRQITGLSQAKFAEKYHINLWTLQNWERGKSKPSDVVLYLLEKVVTEIDYRNEYAKKCSHKDIPKQNTEKLNSKYFWLL